MSQATPAILELKQVGKVYQSRGSLLGGRGREVVALKELSISLNRGEIFGLVGESGSGKTTCGRLIVGLERPDSGDILLEGESIIGLKGGAWRRYRRKVQMIFQDPYQSLNPQLTILDSVIEPLVTNRIGRPEERPALVLEALKAAGLSPPEEFAPRFPHQLSGGQRQRVAIARAMVQKPSLVVADEPTSMLDASYSAQIFEILLEMREQRGTGILFITHSLAAARYLCDRIGVIYRGRLMELGPAGEVIGNPGHPYTQALLDATPKFGSTGEIPRYGTLLAVPRPGEPPRQGCPFFPRCRLGREDLCAAGFPEWSSLSPGHQVACHRWKEIAAAA